MTSETPGFWERLRVLAALFLRLGVIGFGGPLAHVGLMEDQCVTRRQWATRQQFLEGLAICNLLPGPTSTQLSIYLGYLRAGTWAGWSAARASSSRRFCWCWCWPGPTSNMARCRRWARFSRHRAGGHRHHRQYALSNRQNRADQRIHLDDCA